MRSWILFVAVGLSGGMLLALRGQRRVPAARQPTATVAPPVGDVTAADWPIVATASSGDAAPYLRTLVNRPRGALRVALPPPLPSGPWSLHLVTTDAVMPGVEVFLPGYEAPGFVEFYAIEAGPRFCYLQCGERVGPLQRVEIRPSGIVELAAPSLTPQATRELGVRNAVGPGTNLLLEYEGFALVRSWVGEPLTLRSPLDRPRRIVVSGQAAGDRVVRLGFVHDLEATTGPVAVEVPIGDGAVRLTTAPVGAPPSPDAGAAASVRDYRLQISAGYRVVDARGERPLQNVLAVLRQPEFARPPRVHSWVAGEPEQELRVAGIEDPSPWVGVGVSRFSRYVLWRQQAAPDVVRRVPLPAPPLAPAHGVPVLPSWIRTIGQETAVAAGTRQEHAAGPSEIWAEGRQGDLTWRRLVAWTDGAGARCDATAATVRVPWPDGLEPGDQVRLSVATPHALRGGGERFFCEHRGPSQPVLPDMPDGLLNGLLIRRGRSEKTLRTVILGGQVLDAGASWVPIGPAPAPFPGGGLDVLVTDDDGTALVGAGCYVEHGGQAVASTGADGRVRLLSDSARMPPLLSVRASDDRFTHNVFLMGPVHHVGVPRVPADSPRLGWSQVPALTGVDLDGLGIERLLLAQLPAGETAMLTASSSVLLPAPARAGSHERGLLEFVGSGAGTDLWGWIGTDAARRTLADGNAASAPAGTAELIFVNRSAARTIHVTLPRAELRLGLESGRQRRVRVAAPVRLSLLSIVTAGINADQLLVDDGATAELMARDVLVVTYDDAR